MKILITGGAGFVGSFLCRLFKEEFPNSKIVAFDNLHRRGSEINIHDFKAKGIHFVHGDIRHIEDLEALNEDFDLFIEASAEASVLSGLKKPDPYLIQTNLLATVNCLNYALKHTGVFVFLSSSRVYSLKPLIEMPIETFESRFDIDSVRISTAGLSKKGVSELFPIHLPRSLYGATKLASELLIQEYAHQYNLKAVINRCGVICGPGQFGTVEQGVFTLWIAHHHLNKPLNYTGFGGEGKQVRDLLHPRDLFDAIKLEMGMIEKVKGEIFNIGGGYDISVSLKELTSICNDITENEVPIESISETNNVDVPLYLSDYTKANKTLNWKPKIMVSEIIDDVYQWVQENDDLF